MNTMDLAFRMIEFNAGDARRINHFIKVHGYARLIGQAEGFDERTLGILEAAALVHDIGIKPCEAKYGSCPGHLQELEGPPVAKVMLRELGIPENAVDRVCYLVGHHHTYNQIDGLDYQALVEADFLVNIIEGGMSVDQIASIRDKIFKTESGKVILDSLTQSAG